MNYQEFLEMQIQSQAGIISYNISKELEKANSRELNPQEKQLIALTTISTIAPMYETLDSELNKTLHSRLEKKGSLEEILNDPDQIEFINETYMESVTSTYGEGESGADNYITHAMDSYQKRFTEIGDELANTSGISDEQKAQTLAFASQVLNISFNMRIQEAQKIYGTLPQRYAQLIEYKDAA